jgi:hypothetical protein
MPPSSAGSGPTDDEMTLSELEEAEAILAQREKLANAVSTP